MCLFVVNVICGEELDRFQESDRYNTSSSLDPRTRQLTKVWLGAVIPTLKREKMDPAIVSTVSALAGSFIGGFSAVATTWLTQHGKFVSEKMVRETARREALYAEFMTETSRLLVDALEHESQELGQFVNIFAQIGRMRLISSPEVVAQAEKLVRFIADTYLAPNMSLAEMNALVSKGEGDPIRDFSEACRIEMLRYDHIR